jgi:hypothetical protein
MKNMKSGKSVKKYGKPGKPDSPVMIIYPAAALQALLLYNPGNPRVQAGTSVRLPQPN